MNMANPGASFNRDYLSSPGVVFVVNQSKEYDGKYILTSLDFLRQLLDYTTEVSAMELKLKSNVNTSSVQSKIENILGDDFVVQKSLSAAGRCFPYYGDREAHLLSVSDFYSDDCVF